MAVVSILLSFIPLLVLGGIIAAVVAFFRTRDEGPAEPGIGTVRRIFIYGLAFVALMLATSGVTLLVWQVLDSLFGDAILRDDSFRIAFGLAATIVGTPIWLWLWRSAQRSLEEYPAERGTLGRKVYVYLVLGVSAAVVATYLIQLLQGILTPSKFNIDHLAPIIAWGALWGLHWTWEQAEGQPSSIARSVRRLYAYVTSTYGLALLTTGVGQVLGLAFSSAYDSAIGARIIGGNWPSVWTVAFRDAIALAVVGAVWWWYHWHRISAGDTQSILRQIVIYLVAIFGGLVTMVSAAATVLQAFLSWGLGERMTPAVWHFDVVPPAAAAVVVGYALWRYHSAVVLQEASAAGERLVSARRAYHYLTAAVGLGTLATGMATLFGVILGLIIPGAGEDITGGRWWAGPLSVALTLVIVGAPFWWRYWSMRQAAAVTAGSDERQALSRRIFIFAVFGSAVLATLASLSTFLVLVLQPLFEGTFSSDVWEGGKWALGVLLTAGTISVYYWQVLREDRAAAPPEAPEAAPAPAPVRMDVAALAPAGAATLIEAIAARLGGPVAHWRREDVQTVPTLSEAQMDEVAQQVRAAAGRRVVLVIDGEGVRVVPFLA